MVKGAFLETLWNVTKLSIHKEQFEMVRIHGKGCFNSNCDQSLASGPLLQAWPACSLHVFLPSLSMLCMVLDSSQSPCISIHRLYNFFYFQASHTSSGPCWHSHAFSHNFISLSYLLKCIKHVKYIGWGHCLPLPVSGDSLLIHGLLVYFVISVLELVFTGTNPVWILCSAERKLNPLEIYAYPCLARLKLKFLACNYSHYADTAISDHRLM